MKRKKFSDVEWLEFDLLSNIPEISHAVFLRHGGISENEFAQLNFGIDLGDSDINLEHHQIIASTILKIPSGIVSGKQCHGVEIKDIKSPQSAERPECDALTSSVKGIGLMITHADCQAAIFYDPINKAIANVHSGWRGSVQNIYGKVVGHLKKKYGTNPKDLIVCIGPSLGPESSEFVNYKTELPESFWEFQSKSNYFDFWKISHHQLINAGILNNHIEIAKIDTYANPKDFYSYRREKITGRHATIVALNK
jgi:YfiH family protein